MIAAATSAPGMPAFEKISASADSSSHEIVNRCASVAGVEECSLERIVRDLAGGDRHRRAGLRGAAGAGDAGLDIERVETAGLLQRMQARIAHAREKRRVGIEQPVEPVDQDADRQEIEQHLVAPGFAARRRLGARQPARLFAGLLGCFRCGRRLDHRFRRAGCRWRCRRGEFSLSSRADNCRASSLKALFSTGVSTGNFGSPIGRNGTTFLQHFVHISWAFPRRFPNRLVVKSLK